MPALLSMPRRWQDLRDQHFVHLPKKIRSASSFPPSHPTYHSVTAFTPQHVEAEMGMHQKQRAQHDPRHTAPAGLTPTTATPNPAQHLLSCRPGAFPAPGFVSLFYCCLVDDFVLFLFFPLAAHVIKRAASAHHMGTKSYNYEVTLVRGFISPKLPLRV